MSVYRKFASIAHSEKYGYAYDSSQYYDSRAVILDRFRMFETYGDGLTQHSGDWSISVEFLADYLFSLSAAMIDDAELASDAGYRLSDKPRRALIEFAASVVWKESDDNYDKRRYYSIGQQKIGGKKFEYDKRFKQIEKSDDGSPGAILRMILPEYTTGLERYLYATAVRDWCLEDQDKRPWLPLVPDFIGWFKHDHHSSYQIVKAFETAQAITESHRLREFAKGAVENERERIQRETQKKAKEEHAPSETPFPVCETCGNQHHINAECTKVVA